MFKLKLVWMILCPLACALAGGIVVPPDVLPCAPGTLSTYLGLSDGCTIGNDLFNKFGYSTERFGSGISVPATEVMVTPFENATSVGFQFVGDWIGTDAGGTDTNIRYVVATISGEPLIEGFDPSMEASVSGRFPVADIDDLVCLNGEEFTSGCGGDPASVLVLHLQQSGALSDPVTFAAVPTLSVVNGVFVYGGTRSTAEVTSAVNTISIASISQTPEPATFFVAGAGLFALVLKRRRGAAG